jgi:hypothetical protein
MQVGHEEISDHILLDFQVSERSILRTCHCDKGRHSVYQRGFSLQITDSRETQQPKEPTLRAPGGVRSGATCHKDACAGK